MKISTPRKSSILLSFASILPLASCGEDTSLSENGSDSLSRTEILEPDTTSSEFDIDPFNGATIGGMTLASKIDRYSPISAKLKLSGLASDRGEDPTRGISIVEADEVIRFMRQVCIGKTICKKVDDPRTSHSELRLHYAEESYLAISIRDEGETIPIGASITHHPELYNHTLQASTQQLTVLLGMYREQLPKLQDDALEVLELTQLDLKERFVKPEGSSDTHQVDWTIGTAPDIEASESDQPTVSATGRLGLHRHNYRIHVSRTQAADGNWETEVSVSDGESKKTVSLDELPLAPDKKEEYRSKADKLLRELYSEIRP